jgi:hypothetical protein
VVWMREGGQRAVSRVSQTACRLGREREKGRVSIQTGELVPVANRTVGSSAGGVVVQRNHDASGENMLRRRCDGDVCMMLLEMETFFWRFCQLTCQRRCRDRSGTACGQGDEREWSAPSV